MRANEFVIEGKLTVRDAKKLLLAMGFAPTGRYKGSHDIWKDLSGILFSLPIHGKEIEYGISQTLRKMARDKGIKI